MHRLTKLDGALLSCAGDTENNVEHVVAALVGNMWKAYEDGSRSAIGADNFYFLLVDCEVISSVENSSAVEVPGCLWKPFKFKNVLPFCSL